MPETLAPVQSGEWTTECTPGIVATLRLDVEAGTWLFSVSPAGKHDRAMARSGTRDDSYWMPLAVAMGAMPFPW